MFLPCTTPRGAAKKHSNMGRRKRDQEIVVESVAKRTRSCCSSSVPPPGTDISESEDSSTCGGDANNSSHQNPTTPTTKGTTVVRFGKYEMHPWFPSPFPEKYQQAPTLYFCQFCLEYTKNHGVFLCHLSTCPSRRPPGKLVYRSPKLTMFKVDGEYDQLYCERLSLFSKLFLKDKSVGVTLSIFTFYVLCEYNATSNEHTLVGYFSKEKKSTNTLGCILTLPPFQKCGYGGFLISFSYLLAKQRGEVGSPEGPLSALGQRSFLSYWSRRLVPLLVREGNRKKPRKWTLQDLVQETFIDMHDIVYTLEELGLLVQEKQRQSVVSINKEKLQQVWKTLQRKPSNVWAEPKYLISS